MNQPPNNGNGYGDGHDGYDGYSSGAPYGSGPYGDSRQHDGGYGTGQDPYASPGGQQDPYGAPGQQSPYGQPGSGNTGFPSQHQGQGYGPGQPQGNQYPGPGGVYGAAAAGQAGQSAGSGGGIGGLSPKMLGIIGGGVALVLVILLILVFVVFGDSEEKDRRNAIKAAEKFVDTLAEGERFSELNSQLCSRHQADERDVEEIDERWLRWRTTSPSSSTWTRTISTIFGRCRSRSGTSSSPRMPAGKRSSTSMWSTMS